MTLSGTFPAIGVIIPAFRAEKHILKVLAGIPRFVTFIIVVDDCSPDHTAELVRSCLDSRIFLILHEKNQGVGGAMITGYAKAVELGAKIIVKMDSDDQMDPAYLVPLIAPILMNQADYTKGNRFLHIDEFLVPFLRGDTHFHLNAHGAGRWQFFRRL